MIDGGLRDGSGLVIARFEGRVRRDAAEVVVWGRISGKGHRTGGKVVIGSSEEYGRGI